jgi:hypothetical protein
MVEERIAWDSRDRCASPPSRSKQHALTSAPIVGG